MYDKKYKDFRAKQEQIKSKLSNLENADETYYQTVTSLLQLASKAPELFKRSEMPQKRELLKLTLQNLVLKGDKLEFNLLKPFDLLLDLSKTGLWLPLHHSIRHLSFDYKVDAGYLKELAARLGLNGLFDFKPA